MRIRLGLFLKKIVSWVKDDRISWRRGRSGEVPKFSRWYGAIARVNYSKNAAEFQRKSYTVLPPEPEKIQQAIIDRNWCRLR